MDEILKRLAEIKAEAEALRESDEDGRLEKLRTLVAEQQSLELKIEEHNAFEALTKEVPVPVASGDEDEPAGDDAGGGDKEDEAEEAEAPEARVPLAAAAASAKPVDTDVTGPEAADKPSALVASGNVGGTNPGSTIELRDIERIHRHAKSLDPGKGSIKTIFASINTAEGPVLNDSNTAEQNNIIMASASVGMAPITAAAGFCPPDEVIRDICAAGQLGRPVQDLFRTVPVRGRFRYMKTATVDDVSGGVAHWEEADQLLVDPDDPLTWKPCIDLTCRVETTVTPYAVTGCTRIGTWQQLSSPETVANWLNQLQRAYVQTAEQLLLDRIRAQSRVFSAGATAGIGLWTTLNAVLADLEIIVGQVNRETTEGYVIVAPYGFTASLAADEHMKGFSDNKGVQRIQQHLLEDYGVRIVETWEVDSTVEASWRTPALNLPALGGAATALTNGTHTPDRYPLYVLNPSAFAAGASDVVEAGFHSDANLVRQNVVQYFQEGMEFLEKTCDHESFVVELLNCPNGGAAPLGDAISCAAAL